MLLVIHILFSFFVCSSAVFFSIIMLPDVVSRKLRHPKYWQRPQSQWSVSTWNKYFDGEKQGSHSALILELDTLIECLEPKTQEYQKASALKRRLEVSVFTCRNANEHSECATPCFLR